MDGDIDGLALICESGKIRQENQVARGRNRKKFCDALNYGDEEDLEEWHFGGVPVEFAGTLTG
ncbi:hypothetical protein [Tropicimonas sp. IMCC34043]|uniref:hypothetical protein n=1 Tax=Tropicimonas sp. IMCC34043 TaxID=2248760 RepID=UPI001E5F8BD8|nr:hypothetical protein [Tropicimonas sp. IMCC34043]